MSRIIDIPNLDQLISRYQAGESELKLSREFKISRRTIRRRLLNAGIIPRNGSQANVISMSRMSITERQARTAASHIAARGRHQPIAERTMRARAREFKKLSISPVELTLSDMLRAEGIVNITSQKAIGPYNVDIEIGRAHV